MKFTVKFVTDNHLLGYDGMNWHAAQELGFDKDIRKFQIFVNQSLSTEEQATTILHEIVEFKHMEMGWHYNNAHKKAYEAESDPQYNDFWKKVFAMIVKYNEGKNDYNR